MTSCTMFNWSALIEPLATFGAALLAFLLGGWAYRRQKEHELVRLRYLEGGIDRFAANFGYVLGVMRHNYARTLQILKLFREVHIEEAADLANRSSFRLIEPERLDLEAGYRLHVLTRTDVFGRAHGMLFALANAAENFFVNDVGSLIRLIRQGEVTVNNQEEVLDRALKETKRYQAKTDRYYTLFYRLQDLGRILERRHISFRDIDGFAEDDDVREIVAKIVALFPPDEDDEEGDSTRDWEDN